MSKYQNDGLKDTTQNSTSATFSSQNTKPRNRPQHNRRKPAPVVAVAAAADGDDVIVSSTTTAVEDSSQNTRRPTHPKGKPRGKQLSKSHGVQPESSVSSNTTAIVSARSVEATPVPASNKAVDDEIRILEPTKKANKPSLFLSRYIKSGHSESASNPPSAPTPAPAPTQPSTHEDTPSSSDVELGRHFPDAKQYKSSATTPSSLSSSGNDRGPMDHRSRGGYERNDRERTDRYPGSGRHERSDRGDHRGDRSSSDRYNRPRRHYVRHRVDPQQEFELFGEARMGIDFAVYENIPAKATGNNTPPSINSFDDVEFSHDIIRTNLNLCGYEQPTPIQKFSIPIALAGRDMIACAQTGSGKTAAFLIPIINILMGRDIPDPPETATTSYRRTAYPQALVIGPTRELVTQIHKEARKFTYKTSIRPVVLYGGTPLSEQARQLSSGCDLIVATPGRLHDFCERHTVSLANISILVLDEADRMLDMGFAPQIKNIIYKFDMPRQDVQTLMFSATFPTQIQQLAQEFLDNYVYVTIGRVGSSTDLITQKMIQSPLREDEKREELMQVLAGLDGLALVFVETRKGADMLEDYLIENHIDAASIHGDRSQAEREQALSFFRSGRCPVLVATDVAARGLSIPNVRYVINYDMPLNIDDYVHRIGRTGRCGEKGTAFSFISEKNRAIISDLIVNMEEASQDIPAFLHEFTLKTSYGAGGRGGGFHRGYGNGGNRQTARGHQDYRFSSGYSNNSNANSHSNNRQPARTTYSYHANPNDSW